MLRPRIFDHRGQRRVLCDTRYGHLTRARLRSIPGLAGWNARQAVMANRFMPAYLVVILVFASGDIVLRWRFGVSVFPWFFGLGPLLVPFGFFVFQNVSSHPKVLEGRARIIRSLTRAWMCPGCGYSLAELEPEVDGCRVCPECGGAWRRGVEDEGENRGVREADRAGP